eukprot:CAMPEP_0194216244 /NCGR_PEP_ID=MMETSP0156-20130528/18612_1 /TAXON_ID=33649 /ORGANISM="Thalassionema nitzschioides, Strain L26-B" /LENGTH=458 /DNA_ID=CAMNT_0038944965 /DNA_START=136 /DNA_END=1512 /DNA_ORIENTATION=-
MADPYTSSNSNIHPAPYELHRSDHPIEKAASEPTTEHSDPVMEHFGQFGGGSEENDSFRGAESSILTASPYPYRDATQNVVEMHLALLYLLSNPEEFQNAIQYNGPNHHQNHYSLSEWNDNHTDCGASTTIDGESTIGDNITTSSPTTPNGSGNNNGPPLPFVVFCDDAEVVLPQAHTASQLFGIERMEGIELEAAAGIHNLSVLFLRWLALMPGGDHLNIIDPPGLTVMRIAGGRYRVTAAHRVIWTWMNEFANLEAVAEDHYDDMNINASVDGDNNSTNEKQSNSQPEPLQIGDLVTMTIVDVFETDNNGRLLSYCPTFDNRQVTKTTARGETIRKSSSQLKKSLVQLSKSAASKKIQKMASQGLEAGWSTAKTVASRLQQQATSSPTKSQTTTATTTLEGFEQALTEAEQATTKRTDEAAATNDKEEEQQQPTTTDDKENEEITTKNSETDEKSI